MKTVIGLFDSFDQAQSVIEDLTSSGFSRTSIKVENTTKGEHAFVGDDDEMGAVASGALVGGLVQAGVPRKDAQIYTEAVNQGGTLVLLTVSDDQAVRAYDIMGRHGSVDLDERMKVWQKSGWTGFTETTPTKTKTTTVKSTEVKGRELKEGEAMLPVIEEEMQVGKREVLKGGLRAYSRVTETPVEETVNLREEHVHVERRPVDRPLTDADRDAFRDKTIEVRERSEEAVVSKQRRVIEEVVIGKDVNQRQETVRDTVRRTDVEVEKMEGRAEVGAVRFEEFDKDFRTHYKGLKLTDSSYDEFLPVYRYGYSLGTDARYGTGDWSTVEPEARRYWEERNPGTWERFKDSVRYAWDKVRGRR